jgi:hypothetical protein
MKFYVGQKVQCIKAQHCRKLTLNSIYTISSISNYMFVDVFVLKEFSENSFYAASRFKPMKNKIIL